MSLDEFCQCTPSEFQAIYDSWREREDDLMKRSWEQTRFIGLTNIAPYSKKRLKTTDIVQFPWERKETIPVRKGTSSYNRMKEVLERWKKK